MKRFKEKKELTPRDIFYRIGIVMAAILLIVYFMPREGRSAYQFDLNRPWRYSQLIATFDFPIYKSDTTIQAEKDSVMKLYEPYFEISSVTEEIQISNFNKDFPQMVQNGVPSYYKEYIEQHLRAIYKRGVLSAEDYNKLMEENIASIRVFTENQSEIHQINELYSQKSAYKSLFEIQDTARYDRFKLQRCNLDRYLVPNLIYDQVKSDEQKKDLLASISYASGMVISGQKIIDRGEIVTEETYNILNSYLKEAEVRITNSKQQAYLLLGQVLCVTIICLCLTLYFFLFRKDYLEKGKSILLLLTMVVIFPIIASMVVAHNIFSVYIIPFTIAPIFIRVFMDSRTAFVIHTTIVLLSAISLKYPYEFVSTQLVGGMVAIYSLRELSQRSQLLRTALIVALTSLIFYFSLDLMQEKNISTIEYHTYIYILINGIMLLFAYPLMFLIEKIFGFTSNVTLVELSNINNELMRNMSEVAPGTFQHSMQVANLATEVANKIGAKAQLVRTGAMYHDIGKTIKPAYFTENQSGVNPHDKLTYVQSAAVIIDHVREGLKLADKHNLPEVIKGFIATHHGQGKTKYFYISYKNKYPDEEIDESLFTYPGPNPQTKEQAILMMADAVEASSRSLKEYTNESISNLVDLIIDTQTADGAFKECPITFQDISTAKEVFKDKLKTIYHTRISYPELQKQEEENNHEENNKGTASGMGANV